MDSIEKIIQQINEKSAEERTLIETTEQTRQTNEFFEKKKQIEETAAKQREKQLQQVTQKYKQLQTRQQMESRQQLLTEKQQFLNSLFTEALYAMQSWTKQDQRQFAKEALSTLPLTGEQIFLAGEKSTEIFTKEWLSLITKELPYQLRLSKSLVPNQAGFLIDDHGVQYNFLYKNLIQDIEESVRFEMATYLFG
ncbi:hypothetical protein RV11_GL002138 [Enterococcus phoeniculicola]|jgi:V/A-type H+-transporting ATPase subunit E|uniref:V-type ATPase, subunit E n=1 Tax=Enterococcus phoeniculicola ATCC BAA-412 TaxID=1158610 RepID=R3W3Z4_9ENTE|nr:hypothetical protein [Enterococcus phoeniculicola]EOL42221.1 hypothetical protein UC3_02572 [Enterococcus phoeniculicola ATCC BAA-412]EOT79500.1 hypothetical protein I589_01009 [Enterococcus phoeniculicola ATCC BAA-412]OJG69807.1 hypothetical protein RV11_GL002138 [Enterococcus phoeniculicola]